MNKTCNLKVDIYSMGVILWELCTGEMPVRWQMRGIRCSKVAQHPARRPRSLRVNTSSTVSRLPKNTSGPLPGGTDNWRGNWTPAGLVDGKAYRLGDA